MPRVSKKTTKNLADVSVIDDELPTKPTPTEIHSDLQQFVDSPSPPDSPDSPAPLSPSPSETDPLPSPASTDDHPSTDDVSDTLISGTATLSLSEELKEVDEEVPPPPKERKFPSELLTLLPYCDIGSLHCGTCGAKGFFIRDEHTLTAVTNKAKYYTIDPYWSCSGSASHCGPYLTPGELFKFYGWTSQRIISELISATPNEEPVDVSEDVDPSKQ